MPDEKLIKQGEFFSRITGALIDCTPEHWFDFSLALDEGDSGMVHVISSNEKHNDVVSPSEALFIATREFQLYQQDISEALKSAQFKVWMDDDNNWKYKVELGYKA